MARAWLGRGAGGRTRGPLPLSPGRLAAILVLLLAPAGVDAAYLSGGDLIVTRLTEDTFRVQVPTFEILGWESLYQSQVNEWGYPIAYTAGTYGVEVRGGFGTPTLITPVDHFQIGDGVISVSGLYPYGNDVGPFAFEFSLPTAQQGGLHAWSVSAAAEIWSYSTNGVYDLWDIEGDVDANRTLTGLLPGTIGSSTSLLPVPEPGTWLLLAGGLSALGRLRKRRPKL